MTIESKKELCDLVNAVDDEKLVAVGRIISYGLIRGYKLLICGNGGSAADAQHFAAEVVGRYKVDGKHLPAIALNTDSSIVTAVANDFGYDKVFSTQIKAYGRRHDTLVAISTSGNSPNVLEALKAAKDQGMFCVGLLGNAGKCAFYCDEFFTVDSKNTPRIQEVHAYIIHELCEVIDGCYQRKVSK